MGRSNPNTIKPADVSFDVVFLDTQNITAEYIPIAGWYHFQDLMRYIEFLKEINKEIHDKEWHNSWDDPNFVREFSFKYYDDAIYFSASYPDEDKPYRDRCTSKTVPRPKKFFHSDVHFPGSDYLSYLIACASALAEVFHIPYKVITMNSYVKNMGMVKILGNEPMFAKEKFIQRLSDANFPLPFTIETWQDEYNLFKTLLPECEDDDFDTLYVDILNRNVSNTYQELLELIYYGYHI